MLPGMNSQKQSHTAKEWHRGSPPQLDRRWVATRAGSPNWQKLGGRLFQEYVFLWDFHLWRPHSREEGGPRKADKVREGSKGGCVKMRKRGERVKKSENFANIINGRPLILRHKGWWSSRGIHPWHLSTSLTCILKVCNYSYLDQETRQSSSYAKLRRESPLLAVSLPFVNKNVY